MEEFYNCPNCGAVREPAESRCPYCGTPYPRPKRSKVAYAVAEPVTVNLGDQDKLATVMKALEAAIMTPNEARECLGLPRR